MPPPPPLAVFVSPHLDDSAFSAGATMAALGRMGWRVALATVFTASVPDPRGFALACQLDKGLGPEVDYLALRRLEDAASARILGVDLVEWLDLPEAPHRGYHSAPELFGGIRVGDDVAAEVAVRLGALVDRLRPDLVVGPQGVGHHVDHLQVIRALLALPGLAARLAWHRDLPYAAKYPEAQAWSALPPGLVAAALPLTPLDLEAKLRGCATYATQLPFQFGSERAMRRILVDDADREGRRLGRDGPAESLLAPPGLASRLDRMA